MTEVPSVHPPQSHLTAPVEESRVPLGECDPSRPVVPNDDPAAAAERLARLILEQAAESIVVCDAQGEVIRVSQAAEEFCEGSPLLRPFAEVFPLRTETKQFFDLEPVLLGKTFRNVDVALDLRGEEFNLILNAGPLQSDQQILGCVVTLTNITKRKRAEESLRWNEAQLQVILESTEDGILAVDSKGSVIKVNRRFVEIWGIPQSVLDQHDDEALLSAVLDQLSEPEAFLEKVYALCSATTPDFTTITFKDGRIFERYSAPMLMGGEVTGRVWSFRDVTERNRVDADRERLTTAIEQAAEIVVVTGAKGDIVYVNPAFESVTGYTKTEVLGQNPRVLQSGVHDASFYRALWETITAGKTWHGRLVNKKKDGTVYTEDATISPVRDASGGITSYVAVKRDISRDLELEAQLLHSQKMEGIGRLAGGVAHDFNNLLSVILNYTEFALESVSVLDPLRDDLLEISKAGGRAAALTRQLLAFSRKQVLQPELLSVNQILGEMEKMLRRILGEDLELLQVLGSDLGLIKADPGQLEQVIMNLAINARDAMPKGGRLTIETANVALDEEYAAGHASVEPGNYVMIAVTDSGVGMDRQTMSRLFEPFFTTKGLGAGTGLGLSMVYGIVRQSGGHIFVYSEPGSGTTFKVYFPRVPSSVALLSSRPPTGSMRAKGVETILVVEDEDALRKVATRALIAAGYTVMSASNGKEALRVSAQYQGKIQLLLTDVVMPNMNGKALSESLSRARPGVKVLYMSGYTDDAIVHHGVLEAGTNFLGKPFSAAALVRKVREVLDCGQKQSRGEGAKPSTRSIG